MNNKVRLYTVLGYLFILVACMMLMLMLRQFDNWQEFVFLTLMFVYAISILSIIFWLVCEIVWFIINIYKKANPDTFMLCIKQIAIVSSVMLLVGAGACFALIPFSS